MTELTPEPVEEAVAAVEEESLPTAEEAPEGIFSPEKAAPTPEEVLPDCPTGSER